MKSVLWFAVGVAGLAVSGCGTVYYTLPPVQQNFIARVPQHHTFALGAPLGLPVCTQSRVRPRCFPNMGAVINEGLANILDGYLEPGDASAEFVANFRPVSIESVGMSSRWGSLKRVELHWEFDLLTRSGVVLMHVADVSHVDSIRPMEDVFQDRVPEMMTAVIERIHVALNESIVAAPQPELDAFLATHTVPRNAQAAR